MDALDIVIPIGNGSKCNNEELRYCLRSIEKYMSNYRSIIIVGESPSWLTNVVVLPYEDISDVPSRNINAKLLYFSNHELFKESKYFVYFNDDYFLTSKWEADRIPLYHGGFLDEFKTDNNWYNEYLESTKLVLRSIGLKSLNFDIHYPLIIHKNLFNECFNTFSVHWKIGGKLLVKSLYCNYIMNNFTYGMSVIRREDCKIRGSFPVKNHLLSKIKEIQADQNSKSQVDQMFSTGDLCLENGNIEVLKELYPEKSKYEI